MKYLLYILFILITPACKESNSPKDMAPQSMKYSTFYWGYNDQAKEGVFLFTDHLAIEKNGEFVLMRAEVGFGLSKATYYKGIIADSTIKLIDSIFLNTNYKTDYSIDLENPVLYHGPTYCLDFSIDGKNNREIQFEPPYSPAQIDRLGIMLDSVISKAVKTNIDTLYLENYKNKLIKISFPNLPPLPLPPPEPGKNIKPFDPDNYKQ